MCAEAGVMDVHSTLLQGLIEQKRTTNERKVHSQYIHSCDYGTVHTVVATRTATVQSLQVSGTFSNLPDSVLVLVLVHPDVIVFTISGWIACASVLFSENKKRRVLIISNYDGGGFDLKWGVRLGEIVL